MASASILFLASAWIASPLRAINLKKLSGFATLREIKVPADASPIGNGVTPRGEPHHI